MAFFIEIRIDILHNYFISVLQVAMSYSKKHGSEKIRVLQLPVNRGKGAAVRKVCHIK